MPHSRCFGPERRVKRRAEYLQIQKSGRKTRSAHFLLSVAPRRLPGEGLRLGVTITTKIDKRAARRNRLRRRIRELFRACACLTGSSDVVVIAQQGATDLSFPEVREELTRLAGRAKLVVREQSRRGSHENS